MASLKVDKKSDSYYVTVVESYRDPSTGKPKSRLVANLGKVEAKTLDSFKRMGERLLSLCGVTSEQIACRGIKEIGRFNYGYVLVAKHFLGYFGLDVIFARITKVNKLTYSLIDYVVCMLAERLNDPRSKLANYNSRHEYLGLPELQLHHFYRSLEYLAANKERIQHAIYQTGRDLFKQKLDVVFYDVTTFYFDSQVEVEDSLRQKGFSKDGKLGKTQVVMGLLIDQLKRPVCYQLYKGDTWEGGTLIDALDRLKKDYFIDKVIIVADRGMLSKANLKAIEEKGYEFIVGERLKTLPEKVQSYLLNKKNYLHEWTYNQEKKLSVRYCQTQYEGRIIIGTWSEKRAKKDEHDRQERKERGEALLKSQANISRKAKHYFLKEGEKGTWQADDDKYQKAAKYDGFLAVASNVKKMEAAQILNSYKHLFQVEHSFRTFKSFLETRPMFHWNNERIEGHMCLCYMAYSALNELKLIMNQKGNPTTEEQLRKALDKMQVSQVQQSKQEFYIRSATNETINNIHKNLKIKAWPEMIHKSQIDSYL